MVKVTALKFSVARSKCIGIALSCIFAICAFDVPAAAEDVSAFHFTQQQGAYQIGIRVIEQYDYSRSFRYETDNLGHAITGERARPIQTLIWYPARPSGAKRMTVGDYGSLLSTETSFGAPHWSANSKSRLAAINSDLQTSLWAKRDAPQAEGHFPIIVYAPSLSATSWENADLCEYLASHGYIVIASPDMGARSRAMTTDIEGIDAQARDIEFLIGYARTIPYADFSKIAVIGYSWGGISNLFAAANDNRISALVALDGSMRYWSGLIKKADIHPREMTVPLLYFKQGDFDLEDESQLGRNYEGGSPLNEWTHGDLFTIHMLPMIHQQFSAMSQRSAEMSDHYAERQKLDYDREDGVAAYGWLSRYTLAFLDDYLKGDQEAATFLKRPVAKNGVPSHFLSVNFRAAKGVPPSFEGFRAAVGRESFVKLNEIYDSIRSEYSDFKLDENRLLTWASELVEQGTISEATYLLKFEVSIYPTSFQGYTSLGDAYALVGQKQLAAENYRNALKQKHGNVAALEKLKSIEVDLK